MGEVDLLDCFLASYRKRMVSRRWYTYLFWHTIYIGMINAWLLYKRDCENLHNPKKDVMVRRRFQAELATSLVEVNVMRKRGRPMSLDDNANVITQLKRPRNNITRMRNPTDDVRYDAIDHWPEKRESRVRTRCRHCSKGNTSTWCSKCNVRLCFTDARNCYKAYHTK